MRCLILISHWTSPRENVSNNGTIPICLFLVKYDKFLSTFLLYDLPYFSDITAV